MRIILSPTKKMRIDDSLSFPLQTPVYLKKTKVLMDYLKGKTLDELQTLFQCNEKIALQNYERFQEMDLNNQHSVSLLSYDGIAFQYMAPQIFTQDYFEYVLYGLFLVLCYTIVIDKALLIGKSQIQVLIVSKNHEEIKELIIKQLDRTCTILHATTGYKQYENPVLMCVLSRRQLIVLNQLINTIDPYAFMSVSEVWK